MKSIATKPYQPAGSSAFAETFIALYCDDQERALRYFLDTCPIDTRQFFPPFSEPLTLKEPLERQLRSFAHALLFQKNPLQSYFTGQVLLQVFKPQVARSLAAAFFAKLEVDLQHLKLLSLGKLPDLRAQRAKQAQFARFAERVPELAKTWGLRSLPFFWCARTPFKAPSAPRRERATWEIWYIDLWRLDHLEALLDSPPQVPRLFCFDATSSLMQCFQLQNWETALSKFERLCGFWVLDEELKPQVQAQRAFFDCLQRAMSEGGPLHQSGASELCQSGRKALEGLPQLLENERAAKDFLHAQRDHRWIQTVALLGPECLLACAIGRSSQNWFAARSEARVPSPLYEWISAQLSRAAACAHPTNPLRKLPIRLMHIVSQLVDQRHAPTHLVRSLVQWRDRERFEQMVLSTERLAFRPNEYPICEQCSPSSIERGTKTLTWLESEQIPTFVASSEASWEQALEEISKKIADQAPDVLVFHGPDLVHMHLIARLPGPLKVLFEHGTLPEFAGFDLVIASTEDAPELFGAQCAHLGARLIALPFCVDRRAQWSNRLVTRRIFGIDEDGLIATTISNHLESRLSKPFCEAVSKILRKCPNLHYAPIGPIGNEAEVRKRFAPDVEKRLHFYGTCQTPANVARAADIYLNEFPFGGCIGILDAMAAGCPVVSMYDRSGPPQARYGGLFMGLDYAICENDVEKYVELACRFAQNPLAYFRASQRAFARYEGKCNIAAYVRQIERTMLSALNVDRL